jgi:hypothetical protein
VRRPFFGDPFASQDFAGMFFTAKCFLDMRNVPEFFRCKVSRYDLARRLRPYRSRHRGSNVLRKVEKERPLAAHGPSAS